MNDKNRGLDDKFSRIERADGESAPCGKHDGCDYFVLDLTHDDFAITAIEAYAQACVEDYPQLAKDLMRKVHEAKASRALERSEWGTERNVRGPAPAMYPDVKVHHG